MGVSFSVRPDQPNYDLLYDKDYYSKWINVNHFIDKKLSFREIRNGYIIPHSVKSNEGGILTVKAVTSRAAATSRECLALSGRALTKRA